MAIQMRRGAYLDFDPSRMLPGEIAVVLSGDDTTDTGKGIYICFSAGDVQRLSTYEEIVREVNDALADAPEMAEMVTNAVNAALIAHPEWTTTVQDGAVTVAKLNSNVTAFTEASSRTNIASGDGITTIWGKIKKWFTDLKAVAFSGAYSDLTGKPTLGDAASQAVANNLTTTAEGSVLDARQGKALNDYANGISGQLFPSSGGTVTLSPGSGVTINRNRSFKVGNFVILDVFLTITASKGSGSSIFQVSNISVPATEDIVLHRVKGNGNYAATFAASPVLSVNGATIPGGAEEYYVINAVLYVNDAS